MAIPVPYFGYSKIGRAIELNNLSYNNPTSFEWDFGDGSPVDVSKDPTHVYTEEGFYTIKLTATNSDGSSEPLEVTLGVGDMVDTLNSTIPQLIDHYIPLPLIGQMDKSFKVSRVNHWQSYLQPLVSIPYQVLPADTHNEFKWPGLVNTLIAQLVAYDLLLLGLNKFLINNGESVMVAGGTDTTVVERQIKSIETGPAKTEWYEGKIEESTSEDFKNISDAYSKLMGVNGAFKQITIGVCQLASRMLIYLPMCENPLERTASFKVAQAKRRGVIGPLPFGIKVVSQA